VILHHYHLSGRSRWVGLPRTLPHLPLYVHSPLPNARYATPSALTVAVGARCVARTFVTDVFDLRCFRAPRARCAFTVYVRYRFLLTLRRWRRAFVIPFFILRHSPRSTRARTGMRATYRFPLFSLRLHYLTHRHYTLYSRVCLTCLAWTTYSSSRYTFGTTRFILRLPGSCGCTHAPRTPHTATSPPAAPPPLHNKSISRTYLRAALRSRTSSPVARLNLVALFRLLPLTGFAPHRTPHRYSTRAHCAHAVWYVCCGAAAYALVVRHSCSGLPRCLRTTCPHCPSPLGWRCCAPTRTARLL